MRRCVFVEKNEGDAYLDVARCSSGAFNVSHRFSGGTTQTKPSLGVPQRAFPLISVKLRKTKKCTCLGRLGPGEKKFLE